MKWGWLCSSKIESRGTKALLITFSLLEVTILRVLEVSDIIVFFSSPMPALPLVGIPPVGSIQ